MAQPALINGIGAAMMVRVIVRMTRVFLRHRMPEANIEPAVEEIMQVMAEAFSGLGAQVEAQKQRPFVKKGRC